MAFAVPRYDLKGLAKLWDRCWALLTQAIEFSQWLLQSGPLRKVDFAL